MPAVLAAALSLLACGGDTTTPAPTDPTTTTTPVTSTVTTADPGPIAIPATGILKWASGETYLAEGFYVPIAVTSSDDGWWSLGADELWLYLQWHEGGESLFDLDLVVLAHAPNAAVDDVVASITSSADVEVTAEPLATTVAGREGMVLDVVSLGERLEGEDRDFRGHSRFISALAGLTLMVEPDPAAGSPGAASDLGFGVRVGREARIWVLDVDGATVTVIAAVTDPEAFVALARVADRLVAGISFDA